VNHNVTALFGMPGFEVLSTEMVDGEWHVGIETPRDLVGCGGCGAVARVKDRRTVTVRDLPSGGVPVVILSSSTQDGSGALSVMLAWM
jgi:hypothetical protein